jgi:transposase
MQKSKLMELVKEEFSSLSATMKRLIRRAAMRHPDPKYLLRCKIIWNLVRGNRPSSIKNHLGCSSSTVTRVTHYFLDHSIEGLTDLRQDNGDRKIQQTHCDFLLLAAECSPLEYGYNRPSWTLEIFLDLLAKTFDIHVAASTISRVLKSLGIGRKWPKPFLKCPWGKRRKNRRLKEISTVIDNVSDDEVVLYVDEVDIHLNPKIGTDWMPKGMQKTVLTPGQNKKRYLAGALNRKTGNITYVDSDQKDSYLFIDQLWTLAKVDYPNAKHIHLVLDNYSIHHSNLTHIAVNALADKITLHFLPPYCPDHNKIERFWKDLHDNVTRNHQCQTIDELMKQVRRYIDNRNKEQFELAA